VSAAHPGPDYARPLDLSIPLRFDGPQPSFFSESPATATPLRAGDFTGEVRSGASCNCAVLTVAPHCQGTHTECVGHLTAEPFGLAELPPPVPLVARLLSVTPESRGADRVITRRALESVAGRMGTWPALVIRTLPNDPDKRVRAYRGPSPAPWFEPEAMQWVVERGVVSLVVDTPSLDRADDGGRLAAHRVYWGLPAGARSVHQASRPQALVTELAFVDDAIGDGEYWLTLQFPAFASDAAPSRPVLYPRLASGS
jgi:kynurenine formamidase